MGKSPPATQASDANAPRENSGAAHFLAFYAWGAAAIGLLVLLVVHHKRVWEFVVDFLRDILPLFFTPVILETTLFIIGLCIVLIWNSVRRKREEADEWVYLSQVDPESELEDVPEALKARAGESVFKKGDVGGIDHREVALERVEGCIELEMFDEAGEALMEITEDGGENCPEVLRLRYLLCRKQHGEERAGALLAGWRDAGIVGETWRPGG